MRPLSTFALLLTVALAAGCGGGDKGASPDAAPGTPKNPLVATIPSEKTADDQAAAEEAGLAPKAKSGAKQTAARTSHPAADKNFSEADSAGTSTDPSYQKLLEQQTRKPASRFTPCNLVRRSEAAAILGVAVRPLVEAPQGPTCIYRAAKGTGFITISVQKAALSKLRKQMRHVKPVAVAQRDSLCGTVGRPALYVPVSSARVLVVTAPCGVAKQFASAAVPRIPAGA
ncbi:MAG TPA: hypothetical protein VNT55_08285 [Baekduia sp.]|nr:hypothetical protein [Baekduia sp.]